MNNPVPIAVKNKETKRGRFSRKPVVRHKVGLGFQLLLWERKVLCIPGFAFSEWGEKESGVKGLLCSFAPCTEVPAAELSSPGNQNIIAIKVYGP